jgi:hypothetical protein
LALREISRCQFLFVGQALRSYSIDVLLRWVGRSSLLLLGIKFRERK